MKRSKVRQLPALLGDAPEDAVLLEQVDAATLSAIEGKVRAWLGL